MIEKTGSYIDGVFGLGKQLGKTAGIFKIRIIYKLSEEEETEDDFETLNLNKQLKLIQNGFNNLNGNYIHSKQDKP